jgi:hypothetical protein
MIFVKEKTTVFDNRPYISFEITVDEIFIEDYKVYSIEKDYNNIIVLKKLLLEKTYNGLWLDTNDEQWTNWRIR